MSSSKEDKISRQEEIREISEEIKEIKKNKEESKIEIAPQAKESSKPSANDRKPLKRRVEEEEEINEEIREISEEIKEIKKNKEESKIEIAPQAKESSKPSANGKPLKRRVEEEEENLQSKKVRHHYNQLPIKTLQDRSKSTILHLRNFNNWIKSILIQRYTKRDCRVLDMGCGKGGDLRKYEKSRISLLVGIDIADVSINEAKQRHLEMTRGHPFRSQFLLMDCFRKDIFQLLDRELYETFDLVSCQFTFHYAFESSKSLHQTLMNIANALKTGGYFIATIPDAEEILERRKESGNEFGNELYKVSFLEETDVTQPTGAMYVFQLQEAINDCPEFLVNKEYLIKTASIYGLECVYWKPFHDMFYDYKDQPPFSDLLEVMKVLNSEGTISRPEWEVCCKK